MESHLSVDRWAMEYQDQSTSTFGHLGDATAARYRHFRCFVEGFKNVDSVLFGLLLSAEGVRDEVHAYDKQPSALLKLAQTGHVVRQLQRLHRILDSVSAAYHVDEPEELKEWKVALDQERIERVHVYYDELKELDSAKAEPTALVREVESEEQAEEVMVLLKAAVDKYGSDVLTDDEVAVIKMAFGIVAEYSGAVIMSLPSWFAAPFEFGSTFGLSKWGSELFIPDCASREQFIEEAATWSSLNHPHVAKFLGACHVGARRFIAHEKTRPLTEYALQLKDNKKEIWNRLREVALSLQYLRERGIQVNSLTLKNVACAQFEDKAVLLESALNVFGISGDIDKPAAFNELGDPQALALLAVNLLRKMNASSNMLQALIHPIAGEVNDLNTEQANDWDKMPVTRPPFVNEVEWSLLLDLMAMENNSIEDILRVILHLSMNTKTNNRHVHWVDETESAEIELNDDKSEMSRTIDPASPNDKEHEEANILAAFAKSRYAGSIITTAKLSPEPMQAIPVRLPAWFIPSSEVDFRSFAAFSAGSFGSVHVGKWFETPVIVKRAFVQEGTREQVLAQFSCEADIWFQLNHINVVKMYGACHVGALFFVCEHAKGGELSSYLEEKEHDMQLVWYSLLNAALGLQYLHENGIIHGDLKGNNILVGADDVVKLTDFGLNTRASNANAIEDGNGSVGAFRWKAPECLSGEVATFASDVYSFAMCIIEIVSGSFPWGNTMPDAAVRFHVKRGRLPPRPLELEDDMWDLIKRMCCLDPSKRVTIDAVVAHLSSIIEDLTITQVLSTPDDAPNFNAFENCVIARGGALMSLVSLARSENDNLRLMASAHLVAVKVSRGCSADREEVEAMVAMLSNSSDREKAWAANAVKNIAWESQENALIVASAGGVDPLLELMRTGNGKQKPNAAMAIANLARSEICRTMIIQKGGIELAVTLLQGDEEEKMNATIALCNMSVETKREELEVIVESVELIITMVRDGSEDLKEYGSAALWYLLVFAECTTEIKSAGGTEPLVALIRSGNCKQKENAMNALSYLVEESDSSALFVSLGGVEPLVGLLQRGTEEEKISAMNLLCHMSPEAQAVVLNAGAMHVLVALLRDGTGKLKDLAAGSLQFLYYQEENWPVINSVDCVTPLIELVRDGTDKQKESALEAISQIAGQNHSIIICDEGFEVLVDVALNGNSQQKENAATALQHILLEANDDTRKTFLGDIKTRVTAIQGCGSQLKKTGANDLDCSEDLELIKFILDGNDQQREQAAKLLALFVRVGGEYKLDALDLDITALVGLAQGTSTRKKGAAILVTIICLRELEKSAVIAAGGVSMFIAMIRDGDAKDCNTAAQGLWILSSNTIGRTQIVAAGGVELLLPLIEDKDDDVNECALSILGELAFNDKRVVAKLVALGAVPAFIGLVGSGTDDQRLLAAGLLGLFGVDLTTKHQIAKHGGVETLLFALVSASDSVAVNILVALQNLCAGGDRSIRGSFESANAEALLTKVSQTENEELRGLACEVLGELASI